MYEADTSTEGLRLVNTPLGVLELTDDEADRLILHLTAELDEEDQADRFVHLDLEEAWIDVDTSTPVVSFHDSEYEIDVPVPWSDMADLAALIEGSPAYVTRYGERAEYEVRWHHEQYPDGVGVTFHVKVDDTPEMEGYQLPPIGLTPWLMTKLVRGLTQAAGNV